MATPTTSTEARVPAHRPQDLAHRRAPARHDLLRPRVGRVLCPAGAGPRGRVLRLTIGGHGRGGRGHGHRHLLQLLPGPGAGGHSRGVGRRPARLRAGGHGWRRPTPLCAACSATRWRSPEMARAAALARRTAERAAERYEGRPLFAAHAGLAVARPTAPGAVARPDPAARVPGRRAHHRSGPPRPRPGGGAGHAPGLRRAAGDLPAGYAGMARRGWDAGVDRLYRRGLVAPARRPVPSGGPCSDRRRTGPTPADRGHHRPAGRPSLTAPWARRSAPNSAPWPGPSAAPWWRRPASAPDHPATVRASDPAALSTGGRPLREPGRPVPASSPGAATTR